MPYDILITAFALTLLFCGGVLFAFPRLGLMDRPKRYGLSRAAVPYPGGVAIVLTVLIGLLVFVPWSSAVSAVFAAVLLLAVTSFLDDRVGLSPFFRLFVQALAAGLVMMAGLGISSISTPLGFSIEFAGAAASIVTLIWILVMINAFNWIDGVPGMTSGVSAVAALILLLLSVRPEFHFFDQSLAIALSALVLGASVAFFIFDFSPPKMVMGDTGSMTLGFLLAVIAIISGGKVATTVLVLGFALFDFVWVIGRRILQKKSPFKGDLKHFHHRLMDAGLSERSVVLFFLAVSALFGTLALNLHTEGKLLALGGILALMVLIASVLYSRR